MIFSVLLPPWLRATRSRRLKGPDRVPSGLYGWLDLWRERAGTRRALSWLNDHELQDIGLTREDADAEISKPFWKR